jgi:hypothetical protein
MIESGYRCAVPTCRAVAPLDIDHNDDYAKVKKHEFSNMIVLCKNCHGLKGKGPRKLDRKALRIMKHNLGLINHRYNDTERRILEHFAENPDSPYVVLPATEILFGYLLKDGLIEGLPADAVKEGQYGLAGNEILFITRGYALTKQGQEFVHRLRGNLAADQADA